MEQFKSDFNVLSRLFLILEHEELGRTALAQRANVNYVRLVEYLDWLQKRDLIELVVRNGKVKVKLKEKGRQALSLFFSE